MKFNNSKINSNETAKTRKIDNKHNNTITVAAALILIVFTSNYDGAEAAKLRCMEDGRFYRNPDRAPAKIWTNNECSKYFLCLEGEVFEFRCSAGLLFDVNRQICDFKVNVDNCDVTAEKRIPEPLLEAADCPDGELGCADGTCLPDAYFCDGSTDCDDGSDEGHCDALHDPNAASACDPSACQLPDCFCSRDGTQVPGNLDPQHVPQMVTITFDDAINRDNWDVYTRDLFTAERTNPNGCPIRATMFVSHQYNDYQQTQKLWNMGHEIAVHSITHRGPEEWWSKNATIEDWFDEMVGQANILHRFASMRLEDVRGMRVPFLRVGWNRQFLMMQEFGFLYDSSMVAPFSDPPLWPYTLDHRMPHKCMGNNQNCPSRSYPGLWQMIMNPLSANDQFTCAMIDSCPSHLNGEDVYRMLMLNFKRHYMTNRAPYGLYFHSAWFKKPEYMKAFQRFLSEILDKPDVWFVTNWQAIQWMRNPTRTDELHSFEPWQCKPRQFDSMEIACELPNVCKLHSRIFQQDRYFHTCAECPKRYPWIRNEFGLE